MNDDREFDHTIYDGNTNFGRIIEDLKHRQRLFGAEDEDDTPTGMPKSQQKENDFAATQLPQTNRKATGRRQLDTFSLGDDDLFDSAYEGDKTIIASKQELPQPDLQTSPLAFFIIKAPLTRRGEMLRMLPNQTIGRKNAHVVLTDDTEISRQHARLQLEDEPDGSQVFVLYDQGTPGGTFVNTQRIRGGATLCENDEIQIGIYTLVFKSLF